MDGFQIFLAEGAPVNLQSTYQHLMNECGYHYIKIFPVCFKLHPNIEKCYNPSDNVAQFEEFVVTLFQVQSEMVM